MKGIVEYNSSSMGREAQIKVFDEDFLQKATEQPGMLRALSQYTACCGSFES